MKIALVALGYPSDTGRGGIGSQTYAKTHALSALGHEVFVISRSMDISRHESIDGKIHVYRIPGMEQQLSEMTEPVQWLSHSMVVAAEIASLLKKIQIDIIEFPEWGAEGYIHLINTTEWNHVPVVIQLHGPLVMLAKKISWPDVNSTFYKIGCHMEKTCIQLADAIYSSSECSAEWVRRHYHPKIDDIPVIHTGVDAAAFRPGVSEKNERPTIVFTGRLVKNKGIEELVDAVIDLSGEIPALQLRLIGGGEEKFIHKIRDKIKKAEAIHVIEFVGFVGKEALPKELSKAHVFAAPSYYEGGPGFVYLEAMACGLPVIGCSGSGVEEVITNGENGLLIPPKRVQPLKEALKSILTNPVLAAQLGNAARTYIEAQADSNYCMLKLEAFYLSVIRNKT